MNDTNTKQILDLLALIEAKNEENQKQLDSLQSQLWSILNRLNVLESTNNLSYPIPYYKYALPNGPQVLPVDTKWEPRWLTITMPHTMRNYTIGEGISTTPYLDNSGPHSI